MYYYRLQINWVFPTKKKNSLREIIVGSHVTEKIFGYCSFYPKWRFLRVAVKGLILKINRNWEVFFCLLSTKAIINVKRAQ
jgi:hypothetical protein